MLSKNVKQMRKHAKTPTFNNKFYLIFVYITFYRARVFRNVNENAFQSDDGGRRDEYLH